MTPTDKLADALRNIVNMLRDHPAMQGREYIDLGIAANNALREYDASLAAPPAQVDDPFYMVLISDYWIDTTRELYEHWHAKDPAKVRKLYAAPQPAPAPVQVDVTDAMVRRFLNWRLPGHIKPDGVYPPRDAPYPMTGTNLLDYDAAKAMLEWVLTDMSPQAQLKRVLDEAFAPDDQHPPEPAADGAVELPPLPARFMEFLPAVIAKEMRDYARAAIAALAQQRVPDAVRSDVERVAAHISKTVEYIDKQYPDAKMLDRGPIMLNLCRWAERLRLALNPQPEARGNGE